MNTAAECFTFYDLWQNNLTEVELSENVPLTRHNKMKLHVLSRAIDYDTQKKKIEWLELWSILCSMAQWSSSYYFGPCSIRFNHYEEIISTYLLGVQNVHFYTFSLWLKISGVFMCLGADKRQCVYRAVFMQRFLTLIIYKSAVWISKDQQKILILSPFLSFAQPHPPPPSLPLLSFSLPTLPSPLSHFFSPSHTVRHKTGLSSR